MEDNGNAKQKKKIIQVKTKYQDTQSFDKLEKVGQTFSTRLSESEHTQHLM